MITQQKAELQALSPQTWNQPTAEARVGDYIREPFMPIIVVVDKDLRLCCKNRYETEKIFSLEI